MSGLSKWLRHCIAQLLKTDADHPAVSSSVTPELPRNICDLAIKLFHSAPDKTEELLSFLCNGLKHEAGEEDKFKAAEALCATVYSKYKFSEYARLFLEDEEFLNYYKRIMDPDNWHSLDRKYTLNQLLKLTLHLPGDIAECGTYKGASAYLMCRAYNKSDRLVHLFDSFEGLSSPDQRDGNYWESGAFSISENVLCETLADFDNYRIYKGWIPERFVEVADRCFSFLHVDVDLYKPTFDSLNFFYERMVAGGIILMDDYGFKTCPGVKLAADEFFSNRTEDIVMLSTGQAFVIKR